MNYTAIDFETGNANYISACSIGISVFEQNTPVRQAAYFIHPPKEAGNFHWYNIKIHGIRRSHVQDSPTFAQLWHILQPDIQNKLVVCHNAVFDTAVLRKCLEFYQIPVPDFQYICTVKVAQKLWPQLENHKLDTVSDFLGIPLHHHEAGSDAHACGLILHHALIQTECHSVHELADRLGIRLGHIHGNNHISCTKIN